MLIAFKIVSFVFFFFYLWNLERHFVQQYYSPKRYLKTLKAILLKKPLYSLKKLLFIILLLLTFIAHFWIKEIAYGGCFLLEVLLIIEFPKAKKVWTRRSLMLLCFAIMPLSMLGFLSAAPYFFIVLLSPFWICFYFLLISYLVWPLELLIRSRYRVKAQKKLRSIPNLRIIAITGSYGKTSLKAILAQILSLHYRVQASPKSVNTLMGLTKFINNDVAFNTEILILECGVDERKGMDRLLTLFTPDIAVLTAIGKMHLATFHSVDSVFWEKKKLLLKAKRGIFNLNNHFLFEHQEELSDFQGYRYEDVFSSFSRNEEGLEVTLKNGKKALIPLFGAFQLQNIAGAIKVAEMLDIDVNEWSFVLPSLRGVDHRLIKKSMGKMIVFDDAYNGNEEGIIEGINTVMIYPLKKGIITPGVIELGNEYEAVNRRIAAYLQGFDRICIVSRERNHPLYQEYITQFGNSEKIFYASSFQEGYRSMCEYEIEVLLIANDTFNTFLK